MRFRIVIYLCALVLMIGGSDLYAASNAQKRAKQRAKTEQKRAAAKRKAEKKRAAKLKADKKKRIKEGKPLLYVYSYNLKTGEPLPATHITRRSVSPPIINAHASPAVCQTVSIGRRRRRPVSSRQTLSASPIGKMRIQSRSICIRRPV